MDCPHCMNGPVVYDPGLQALVCTHCGTVLDDRPIPYTVPLRGEEYLGSYVKSRRYKRLMYTQLNAVYWPRGRLQMRINKVVKTQCKDLGVSWDTCVTARQRVREAVRKIMKHHDVRLVRSKVLRRISAACLYAVLTEQGVPIRLSVLSDRLGLDAVKVYDILVEYGDEIGFKYVNKTKNYLSQVAQALIKQLGVEDAGRVVKRAGELLDKYSYFTTDPLKSAVAFTVLAARELGLKISVVDLCTDLGITGYEQKAMYTRVRRLAEKIRGLKNI